MPQDTIQLSSTANPRVKQVVRLREHRERRKTGLFLAEGLREISRACEAGLKLESLFICPELLGTASADVADRFLCKSSFSCTASVFRKMAYLQEPEGVLAVMEQRVWKWEDLPTVDQSALWLVAVGTEKPGNLGAMARTAQAAGCQAMIAAGTPVDIYNPNAIRASTGAVFSLPILCLPEAEARERLLQAGMQLVCAEVSGAVLYTEVNWRGATAIVIGPEDRGLDAQWLESDSSKCQRVRIPMAHSVVDSLNAANSAAILLFEAVRQRQLP